MGHEVAGVTIVTCEYAPFPGGIGTYSTELARTVCDAGHPATVIAPAYEDLPPAGPELPEAHRLLRHHAIPVASVPRIAALLRAVPAGQPVLCADIRSAMLVHVLRPYHRKPYRIGIHGSEVSKLTGRSPALLIARRAYAGAERIIANSRSTLDTFLSATGYSGPASVAYLGVDRTWFDAPEHPAFETAALADVEGSALFCAVGRVEPRKGQLDAVRALSLARDRYGLTDPVLVAAGHIEVEAYAEEVRRAADAAGLRLVMPGRLPLDDVKRLYRRSLCHFLLASDLPGRREGFGLVLIEAAAAGCPSIASAAGGIPEALGESGVVVAPGDVEEAAQAAAAFAAQSDARCAAGAASLRHAEGFTWRACAAATFPELTLS